MTERICYVVSRFPKATETFVANEWNALADRFDMHLAALRRGDLRGPSPAVERALARTWFLSPFRPSAFTPHARALHRDAARYRAAVPSLRGTRLEQTAKTAVAFHQGVHLAELVREHRIDHVHAHFANAPTVAAWVAHRLTGVPFSFTAHANDLYRAPRALERFATDAAFVIAISEYNQRLLAARAPDATVHVVHCGVGSGRFAGAPAPRAHPHDVHVLCVAGLQRKKGHRDLLHAFAELARERPTIRLTLIGDGPERTAIERTISELGLGARVTMLGARTADDVANTLGTADLFVLPAVRDATGRMDGIPVALMEAMAAGVPVVSTSVSGIPELVRDEETGLTVAPSDVDALATAMARLLDDHALRARVTGNARELVRRDFDLYVEAAKLGDLFASSVAAAPV